MENFGERLSKLLIDNNLSKNKVAVSLKVHPTTISNYIKNITKPDLKIIRIMSDYFQIDENWLLTGEGSKEKLNPIKNEIKEVDFDEFMEAEYLPITVQAGYLSGLEDNNPIELKKMLVPKEFEKGFYKVIEIEGDSMNDGTPRSICDGDKLLLKELDGGDYLKKTLSYRTNLFVIVSKEGIVCKQITAQDIEKECIVCHSFNSLHSDYEICFEDIYQLFYVKKLVERKIKF